MRFHNPNRALIYADNLAHNLAAIKKCLSPTTKICLCVKANAYGHGLLEIAVPALAAGAEALAVASVAAGAGLRQAGVKAPILFLSHPCPEENADLVHFDLQPLVGSPQQAHRIAAVAQKQGKTASVTLKIDTGMGRNGCSPNSALALAQVIAGDRNLTLAGVCSHFPVADEESEYAKGFTDKQTADFHKAVESIKNAGINPGAVSLANSAAALDYPASRFDMVRVGLAAYGYRAGPAAGQTPILKPVMALESRVVHLKEVAAGTALSYGHTYRPAAATRIATVRLGYGDGYPWRASNRARVSIGGRRYPIVGRVCMDHLLVDLGRQSLAALYDSVCFFGPGQSEPSAEEVAVWSDSFVYEVLTRVAERVPRCLI